VAKTFEEGLEYFRDQIPRRTGVEPKALALQPVCYAADTRVALVDGDGRSGSPEMGGRRKAPDASTDDADSFAPEDIVSHCWWLGLER